MKNFLSWISIFGLAAGALGCAGLESLEKREALYGKEPPVIQKSYAAERISPGDTWRIYLTASDPDGDMKHIVCTLDQAGVGTYPVSFTRISEERQKELAGYIYLNTLTFQNLDFVTLALTVQIQDRAGHFSEPAVFSLLLAGAGRQDPPPPGLFPETDLGPIMIRLRTIHDDMESPFDRGLFFRGGPR